MDRRVALLGVLYLCEGLPYGFQATALPAYLRASGVSLAGVGLVGALALPWLAKPLWAPWVDAHGTRRQWILPLLTLLAMTTAAAAWVPPADLPLLLALVFAMNALAATLDIAVDGYAVDVLEGAELGPGNAAQVVGYKLGMLGGGGLLVWLAADVGWPGVFAGMTAILSIALAVVAVALPGESKERPPMGAAAVAKTLGRTLLRPGTAAVLVVVGTYKIGEVLASTMWKPYLIDAGYTPAELGLLVGTFGMSASLVGSLAGGSFTARLGPDRALVGSAWARAFALSLLAVVAVLPRTRWGIEWATVVESFCAGAVTTAMFAYMMSRVNRTIGAAHYTLLAAVEVLGKVPVSLGSGFLAEKVGYPATFALGAGLAFAFSLALPSLLARAAEQLVPAPSVGSGHG